MKPPKNEIPFSHLQSPLFERTALIKETKKEREMRYAKQHYPIRVAESIGSRLFRHFNFDNGPLKWTLYRLFTKFAKVWFRFYSHIEIQGQENIPKEGAIFLANHINHHDVVVAFMSVFRQPVGVFTAFGDSYIIDVLQKIGFVPRWGYSDQMVEKMIRQIYAHNRYFVMWPEGTPDKGYGVMEGFSGITKVYSTLNSDRDRVPFVPVAMHLFMGPPKPRIIGKKKRVPKKLIIKLLPPVYLPRPWLLAPEKGGKTAREMIDHMMLIIAADFGQEKLALNPRLRNRRKNSHVAWD